MPGYNHDLPPELRARIVGAIQERYDAIDPARFEVDSAGHYPSIGEGKTESVLGWLYPAAHMILEPRANQEERDREVGRKMVLRTIRQGLFREKGHAVEGMWHWSAADQGAPPPTDRNTSGFMGCGLVRIWALDPKRLSDWSSEDLDEYKDAVRLSVESAFRHWVRLGYTNPQCMDFFLGYAAAEILSGPSIRDRTRDYLLKFKTYADTTNTFEEWVSPTYASVNLTGLVPLAHLTRGTEDEELVDEILDLQWQQLATAAHGPTREICGPHSRAYSDVAGEARGDTYAWLHLADSRTFPLHRSSVEDNDPRFPDWIRLNPTAYVGLAAPGLYLPLGVPSETRASLASAFETPVETRENYEWIGGPGWEYPHDIELADIKRPTSQNPRFRLGTRYRTSSYCLGSINELDGWLQRRPCVAYWKDERGVSTGLKWQVHVEAGDEKESWVVMQAFEFKSVQSGGDVIGAYHIAPVIPAKPDDVLQARADWTNIGTRGTIGPRAPIAWLLGTHWRQSIEQEHQGRTVKKAWIGITPIGSGSWNALDTEGRRWAFSSNGIEAVIETSEGASITPMANRTAHEEPVDCLELWSANDVEWDWLDLPQVFMPFGLRIQSVGDRRTFGLRSSGSPDAFELERGDLRMKWSAPTRPDAIDAQAWWGWKAGHEIRHP